MLAPSIYNDFFNNFFGDWFKAPSKMVSDFDSLSISTDVQEFEDHYQLDMELPGFDKEEVKAELKDGYLTITAEHNENKDEKDGNGKFIRKERYFGQSKRSFYVGENITQEDIHASFKNGVLMIDVPKKEAKPEIEESRYISID